VWGAGLGRGHMATHGFETMVGDFPTAAEAALGTCSLLPDRGERL
jgi:hypothetical protein